MTSNDICWVLRKKYCAPEYAIAFEVGNRTGTYTNRHLDAIAMSLYPSRGLNLTGFEIKVNRQDLKREIAAPDKAEAVAQYLDYFYVVFPEELKILDLEIPPGWGLMSVNEEEIKVVKYAEKISAIPISKEFLGALFRSMCAEDEFRIGKLVSARTLQIQKECDDKVNLSRVYENRNYNEKLKWANSVVDEIESAGFRWRDISWNSPKFTQAVKDALTGKTVNKLGIKRLADMLEKSASDIRANLSEID